MYSEGGTNIDAEARDGVKVPSEGLDEHDKEKGGQYATLSDPHGHGEGRLRLPRAAADLSRLLINKTSCGFKVSTQIK